MRRRDFITLLGGAAVAWPGSARSQQTSDLPRITEVKNQIVVMRIVDFNYQPNRFTVKVGVPVEWRIDSSAAAPCGRLLYSPGLGIRELLSTISTAIIRFTPTQTGEFAFNCGMGMMTRGSAITVVPNTNR